MVGVSPIGIYFRWPLVVTTHAFALYLGNRKFGAELAQGSTEFCRLWVE